MNKTQSNGIFPSILLFCDPYAESAAEKHSSSQETRNFFTENVMRVINVLTNSSLRQKLSETKTTALLHQFDGKKSSKNTHRISQFTSFDLNKVPLITQCKQTIFGANFCYFTTNWQNFFSLITFRIY